MIISSKKARERMLEVRKSKEDFLQTKANEELEEINKLILEKIRNGEDSCYYCVSDFNLKHWEFIEKYKKIIYMLKNIQGYRIEEDLIRNEFMINW